MDEMLWCDHSNENYRSGTFLWYCVLRSRNSFNYEIYGRNTSGFTIQIRATERYFPVVLFIMLYKIILTFAIMDEIQWCDYSNESYSAVLFFGTVRMFTLEASRGSSSFFSSW